jgi:hypothetical protein
MARKLSIWVPHQTRSVLLWGSSGDYRQLDRITYLPSTDQKVASSSPAERISHLGCSEAFSPRDPSGIEDYTYSPMDLTEAAVREGVSLAAVWSCVAAGWSCLAAV